MSIRTIIEINHDRLGDFDDETWKTLVFRLKGCETQHWGQDRALDGLKFLAQRHHSTKITVTCE